MNLTEELVSLKCRLGIRKEIECTWGENKTYRQLLKDNKPLPQGVQCSNPDSENEYKYFYTIKKTSLSKEELAEYVQYKQLETLIAIKRCVVFFTVLTIISLIAGLILLCQ